MDEITWRDFILFVNGYNRRVLKQWEQTRFVGYMVYKMHTGDKIPKTIYKFLPLASDPVEDRGRPLTDEEIQLMLKLHSSNGSRNTTN